MAPQSANLNLPWLNRIEKTKRFSRGLFGSYLQNAGQYLESTGRRVSDSGVTRSDVVDTLYKLSECSSLLELRAEYLKDSDGNLEQKIRLHNANFCQKYLICPNCAARVQKRRRARFRVPIQAASEKYQYAYMLTFTIRDSNDLGKSIRSLKASIRSFVRMGQKRIKVTHLENGNKVQEWKRGGGEFAKVGAGFLGYEIKRGEGSGLWHVHAHGLFFTDQKFDYQVYDQAKKRELEHAHGRGKVPKEELDKIALGFGVHDGKPVAVSKMSREWLACTSGQSINIRVDPIHHVPEVRDHWTEARKRRIANLRREVKEAGLTKAESIYKQSQEVLKYITIHEKHNMEDITEIIEETHGQRFFSTYGDFRSVGGSDFVNDETRDSKEIWSLSWSGDGYGQLQSHDSPIIHGEEMTDKRKRYLGMQAKALGAYRRRRAAVVDRAKLGRSWLGVESTLDAEKAMFRSQVSALWKTFFELSLGSYEKTFRQYVYENDLPVEQLSFEF